MFIPFGDAGRSAAVFVLARRLLLILAALAGDRRYSMPRPTLLYGYVFFG